MTETLPTSTGNRLLRMLFVWIQPESDFALCLVYTSAVVLTIALLLGSFYLMKRFTLRLLKVVAGRA